MVSHEIARVYEVKLPIATMPSADVGMLGFSANGQSFSILMSRADFQRLGRKIARLLAETPAPVRKRGANLPSSEK
jgi:hypothetical protein